MPIKKKNTASEWHEQAALVKWARLKNLLLLSIPNHGKRTYWGGQREKMAGLFVGASDLFLAMPNNNYHGYFIEMKKKGNKPTEFQYQFGELVKMQNYKWEWFNNYELARDSIIDYLGLNN